MTKTLLQFSSNVTVNSVVWISSLPPEDDGLATRVLEDLQVNYGIANFPLTIATPHSAKDLWLVLDWISASTLGGNKPVIHFDMHGLEHQGMRIAETNEWVSWPDLLNGLRAINIRTENNLCVILTVCFAANIIRYLTLDRPAPFYLLIAPETTMSAKFIESRVKSFYESLPSSTSLTKLYEQHLSGRMQLFQCEKIMLTVLVRYIIVECSKPKQRLRQETLLTAILSRGIINTHSTRQAIRKHVKGALKPSQQLVDKAAKTFLIGRPPKFTFADLQAIINYLG